MKKVNIEELQDALGPAPVRLVEPLEVLLGDLAEDVARLELGGQRPEVGRVGKRKKLDSSWK